MKVSFRIRRVYFEQIVAGTKTVEVRRASDYWITIYERVIQAWARGEPVEAVFVCGKDVHRRRLARITPYLTAQGALGRAPSEQGRQDIGDGPVLGFFLGEMR